MAAAVQALRAGGAGMSIYPPPGCDAKSPTIIEQLDGTTVCVCLVCDRCGRHADNYQGHYTSYCLAISGNGRFHFCCPGNCELGVP